MKKRFIALIICVFFITMIIPTVSATTVSAPKIDINLEETSEIQKIANTSSDRGTFKQFIRGRIDDLYVDGEYVYFFAKAVRTINFMSDGSSVILTRNWYWKVNCEYFGLNFRGIMRPGFIFGVFSGSI